MKYAALHGAFVRFAAAGATDAALGAWARVMVLASELETQDEEAPNTARLAGAATWDDRRWISATGTDRAGVQTAVGAGLAAFDGDDLVVFGYDAEGHQKTTTLRDNGRFGKLGGRPKAKGAEEKPSAKPSGLKSETLGETLRVKSQNPDGNPDGNPLPLLPTSPSLPTYLPPRADEPAASPQPSEALRAHLEAVVAAEFEIRGVDPQKASAGFWRDGASRVQLAVAQGKFPDAGEACGALARVVVAACSKRGGKLGFALQQEPFAEARRPLGLVRGLNAAEDV